MSAGMVQHGEVGMVRRFLNRCVAVAALLVVGACGTSPSTSGPSESPGTTAQMVQMRLYHSATLLSDGKVLIAGGSQAVAGLTEGRRLVSAEVYDPATGRFGSTGNMVHPRKEHKTVLLQDGRVLVVGGGEQTAELYDPTSGGFTPTGDLTAVQTVRTATLLPDGRVFLTGDGIPIGEIYDPAIGGFTRTGRVGATRIGHTTTPLAEGIFLFIGGGVRTAGFFNLATGSFSAAGDLTQIRFGHTATQLQDGKILIAGGSRPVTGGPFTPTPGAEIYDPVSPVSRAFTATGFMGAVRFGHVAIPLPDGKVLIVGGADAQAEVYDPQTGVFHFVGGGLERVRSGHTATLLSDGRVLIAGGADQDFKLLEQAILYRP